MVAKITPSQKMRAILYYNENKVADQEARLILASGFAGDAESMSREQKMNRFNHLLRLKPHVKTHAVHMTLNFHSSEKLGDEKLQQIAIDYLEKVGFGDQPFLVYRHLDSAHTHLHIVSTNITADGKRINLHNIGMEKSEPARKAIEDEFKLIKAQGNKENLFPKIKKVGTEKIKYGRLPTKRAISNVLTAVNREYKFTSIAEYNAVLKCFGVMAIRGDEGSAMFEKKGLIYSVIDEKGSQIGVPIKASAFEIKPTLRNLEARFEKNNEKRRVHREDLKNRMQSILAPTVQLNRDRLLSEAEKLGISVIFRENDKNQLFGVTYVDHKNKCVFNGSDLGKAFSAKAISERLLGQVNDFMHLPQNRQYSVRLSNPPTQIPHSSHSPNHKGLLETLLSPPTNDSGGMVSNRKKKKRKQQLTL